MLVLSKGVSCYLILIEGTGFNAQVSQVLAWHH